MYCVIVFISSLSNLFISFVTYLWLKLAVYQLLMFKIWAFRGKKR